MNTRSRISSNEPWDDFLESVYASVGCSDVKVKPDIAYKFSNDPKRELGTALTNEDDWEEAIGELCARISRQRAASTSLSMIITLTDTQVSARYLLDATDDNRGLLST